PSATGSGLLVVGGPDFGRTVARAEGRRFPAWSELPGARLEAQRVAALYQTAFPKVARPELLVGSAASRRGLLAALRAGPLYLHLATHGFFDKTTSSKVSPPGSGRAELSIPLARNPLLLTGLVLAGANSEEYSLLTALEVAGLDLRKLDLAVLSACETG